MWGVGTMAMEIYDGTIQTTGCGCCSTRYAITEDDTWFDDMPVLTKEILDSMIEAHTQMLSDLQQIKREQFGG